MPRLKDWPSRFAALVEESRSLPFAWGTHDCCLWAASAVLSITGRDPGAAWRRSYFTGFAALRILESIGGLAGAGALMGPEIAPALATEGDVGLVRWPCGTQSLAVRSTNGWMCAGDDGLIHLPHDAALRAWGVGRE